VKFPTNSSVANGGTPDANYYRHVFEMLLRLRYNLIWAAMHEGSTSFNIVEDENGIPVNSKLASDYGVIPGSAHCDILLRTNVGEWDPWINAHYQEYMDECTPPSGKTKEQVSKSYDFTVNKAAMTAYWRARLETIKDFEVMLTIGLRGMHDGGFSFSNGAKYGNNTVEFMKDVIMTQRALIEEVYGVPANQVPQILIPYSEINDIYNAGLNTFLMQEAYRDITLIWANDNHGYLRQSPTAAEAARTGGNGIYYHASYWGAYSFLWTNETQLSTMSEQMHRAFDTGADDQWILNVGDIKPGELPMEFFVKLAWDPDAYNDKTIESVFLKEQALRDYRLSEADAETVADAMDRYCQLIGTKKSSWFNSYTPSYEEGFSLSANGDEALLFLARCNDVVRDLGAVYEKLPEPYKTAFYQQIYYNATAIRDAAEQSIYYNKNQLSAAQGRYGSAQVYAALSQAAGARIDAGVIAYNGQNGNKWSRMMQLNHWGGNVDRIEPHKYAVVPEPADGVGAAAENQTEAGTGILRFNSLSPEDQRYFDVFGKNDGTEFWVAETDADWVLLSQSAGETCTEERVVVTADWTKLNGSAESVIRVYNADEAGAKTGDPVAVFTVKAVKSTADLGEKRGFAEANGYVAIEAEHFTQKIDGASNAWSVVKSSAQHGDTMKTTDTAAHTEDWANTAKLVYSVYFEQSGTYSGVLKRLPTLNEGSENGVARSMNLAIGVGENTPAILKGNRTTGGTWSENVLVMHERLSFQITVQQGWNDIILYAIDPSVVIDRFEIQTEAGALAQSLLGPAESPNSVAGTQPARAAALPALLAETRIYPGMALFADDAETVYAGEDGITAAESGETRVATVRVDNGKLLVTPVRVGSAVVTAADGDGKRFSFSVTVRPKAETPGVYAEQDGLVVIDAGDAAENSAYAYVSDTATHQWALSGLGIQALPDTNAKWTDTTISGLTGKAPAVSYVVDITNAGTYYLYLFTRNPNPDGDSYHLAVDGTYRYTYNPESGATSDTETWYSTKTGISLSEGEHTLTIYAREDGFLLNQLLLSKSNALTPSGLQNPTPRVLVTPKITMADLADVTLFTTGAAREITLSATASGGRPISFEAVSDNTDAAAVSPVSDGKFTVTPAGAGSTTVTVTVTATAEDCEPVQKTFTVTVKAGGLYYQPDADGTIVINAVDALLSESYANHSNVCTTPLYAATAFAWAAVEEGKSLQLTPVGAGGDGGTDGQTKWRWLDTTISALDGKVPSISFQVNAAEAGAYYLSVFSNTPNINSDSFHIAVNRVYQFQTGDTAKGYGDSTGERWNYCKAAVTLNAGVNTLTIYARESGMLLRQFMLSRTQPGGLTGWQAASEMGEQPPRGAYLPGVDGAVVINARDAAENSAYAYVSDIATHQWALSGAGIQALPDTNAKWTDITISGLAGKAPAVSYVVDIADAGNYYLYLNTSNPNTDGDSYHLVVDGTYRYTYNPGSAAGAGTWYSPKTQISLSEGEHTLTIYAREDGFLLNQLLLSSSNALSPSGLQNPSPRKALAD
jgi:hypothetical protein